MQSQLDQVKASSASSLAEFEAKAAVINSELQQAISQRDELSARLLEMQSESATKLAESDSERMALAAQLRDVNSAKDELAVQLDEIRASYADNVSAREKLDMRIGDLEAELASAREKSTTATAERDALQSQLSADQDSIRVEMEELFTAKHALEKKVYKLEASERALQGEVETLTTEAACTAEAHAAVITAKGAEKQAADEELALVQGELATVRTTTAELQSSMTAKTAELHRLNELVDDLTGEIALRDADEMKVHHDMALLSLHIAAAERDKEAAEKANAEVLAKMAELQYAQDEAASIAVAKDELQATVEQKETELVALRKHKEAGVAVSAEKDQLSTKIAELETRIESLRAEAAEAATLRAEKQELDARAAEMETRILEMTDATDKLRAELEEARSTAALVATDAQGQVAEATQFAADLKQQLIASEDAKTALQAAVHNAEKRIFYLEERIAKLDSTEAELRAELAAVKEERDDGVSRITEISASLAAAEEKAGGQLLSIERLTAKLEAAETRAVALSADSESMIKLEEEKTRLREQLEDAQSKLEEGKANVAELSDELAAGRANVADAERAAQTAAQGLLDLKSRLAEAELEAEKRVPMDEMNRM